MENPAACLLAIDGLLDGASDAHKVLGTVLARAGEAFGAHRANVFTVHELPAGGLGQSVAAQWRAAGYEPIGAQDAVEGDALGPESGMLWDFSGQRRRGEGFTILTRMLEGRLRYLFERQGILSTCSEPIFVHGDWWGHLNVNDCEMERTWSEDERAALRLIARLVGRALGRTDGGLSEAMRAAMVASAPEAIVVIDEDGCVCEFNPAAEEMFGIARGDVIGRPVASVVTPARAREHPRRGSSPALVGEVVDARSIGHRITTEGERADGSTFPVELAVTEVKADGRRLFAAYLRDLTTLRATEAALERQREALTQSEKLNALGAMLAGVAHELNNPLSVVVGRAFMLEEQVEDPRISASLRRLREAADRCAQISRTFLTIARKTPTKNALVDVTEPLRNALDFNAYALRSTGVEVMLEAEEKVPLVFADADLLVQVFSNLIVNAEHALRRSPAPRLLQISVARDGERGVRIDVTDNGPGIPQGAASRVFEPFYTTKGVGMGTGLGLSVSRGMVEAMGGTIIVDPGPARGTRFSVQLPVAEEIGARQPEPVPANGALNVLIVDDEPDLRMLLTEFLTADGCSVDEAEDGAVALRLIAGGADYDAILADARMPKIDGATLYREAIAIAPQLAGRFAIITGDTFLGSPPANADGPEIIAKPFEPSRLRAFLRGLPPREQRGG